MVKSFLVFLLTVVVAGCSVTPSTTTTSTIVSTTFDMTTASKAAYTARASYYGYLVIADKIKKQVPICSGSSTANICITAEVMATLRATELSTDQATLAGEKAVLALGNSPSVIRAAIVASEAAVSSFKAQTDIWKDKV